MNRGTSLANVNATIIKARSMRTACKRMQDVGCCFNEYEYKIRNVFERQRWQRTMKNKSLRRLRAQATAVLSQMGWTPDFGRLSDKPSVIVSLLQLDNRAR